MCATAIEGRLTLGPFWVAPYYQTRLARLPTLQSSPPTLWHSTVKHPATANIWVHNTKMPEVTATDRQNAILDVARKLYSDGKFKAALAAFKEASS